MALTNDQKRDRYLRYLKNFIFAQKEKNFGQLKAFVNTITATKIKDGVKLLMQAEADKKKGHATEENADALDIENLKTEI